jgi:hypothetical protein
VKTLPICVIGLLVFSVCGGGIGAIPPPPPKYEAESWIPTDASGAGLTFSNVSVG